MALPRRAPAAKAQSKAPATAAWSLAPDDDEELLDDSELLTEEDLQRPSVPSKAMIPSQHFGLAMPTCLTRVAAVRTEYPVYGIGAGFKASIAST